MSASDDDVRAAAARWRLAYDEAEPDGYFVRVNSFHDCQADKDCKTLANALLAWEDRFGGEFPPGFFAAPTPKPTTKEPS